MKPLCMRCTGRDFRPSFINRLDKFVGQNNAIIFTLLGEGVLILFAFGVPWRKFAFAVYILTTNKHGKYGRANLSRNCKPICDYQAQ